MPHFKSVSRNPYLECKYLHGVMCVLSCLRSTMKDIDGSRMVDWDDEIDFWRPTKSLKVSHESEHSSNFAYTNTLHDTKQFSF